MLTIVRMGKWKGIRLGRESELQLYDLENDVGEKNNIADKFPDVVTKIEAIMEKAAKPSPRYPVGTKYEGGSIWKKVPGPAVGKE